MKSPPIANPMLEIVATSLFVCRFLRRPLDRQAAHSQSLVADDYDSADSEIDLDLIEVRQQQRRLAIRTAGHVASEEDDARDVGAGTSKQSAEVGVEGEEHSAVLDSSLEHDRIRRAGQSDLTGVDHVVASGPQRFGNPRREAFVEEEPQAPRRRGSSRSRTASAAYSSASRTSRASRSG